MQQLKTIENNLITSIFKVIINFNKTRYTVSGFIEKDCFWHQNRPVLIVSKLWSCLGL
jgi:hypothetical protein